jgi:hypothetical protein
MFYELYGLKNRWAAGINDSARLLARSVRKPKRLRRPRAMFSHFRFPRGFCVAMWMEMIPAASFLRVSGE